METNEKMYLILIISGICLIVSIVFNWGVRARMVELQEWKTTYESGYCPTCGHKLNE